MSRLKGFTLTELIVVMIITGALAVIAVPGINKTLQQKAGDAANNNLSAIYNAQKIYYLNNNGYCLSTTSASPSCQTSTGDSNCADQLPAINCNMSLNITDNYYNYACNAATSGSGFNCTATNPSSGNTYSTCGAVGANMNTPVNGTCTDWSSCSGSCTFTGTGFTGSQTCTGSTTPQCGGVTAIGTTRSCSYNCCCSWSCSQC